MTFDSITYFLLLGGDIVPGIDPHPKNDTEAKENVERLFRFLIRKGVALQSITPKGNKS